MLRAVTPKTQRAKRALQARAPKVIENPKQALFLRGHHTSAIVTGALRDLYALKKPDATLFQRNNSILPFEDASSLEFFSNKNDCGLFALASHNKKRPNNLVLGRFFDHHLLDMIELGVDAYVPMSDFKTSKIAIGAKHSLVFAGQLFETNEQYKQLKSIFLDMFRGDSSPTISLEALDHVIAITADEEGAVYLRVYMIALKKSNSKLPYVELEEMGPALDMTIRRHKDAAPDVLKEAMRVAKQVKPKAVKNVITDALGTTIGRVHVGAQDFSKIALKKMKGLRKRPAASASGGDDNDDGPDGSAAAAAAALDNGDDEPRARKAPPAKRGRRSDVDA